jgi:hypothetical protein
MSQYLENEWGTKVQVYALAAYIPREKPPVPNE